MRKCSIGQIILAALLICNLAVLGCVGYVVDGQLGFITMLENKIDILSIYQEELILELENMVLTVMDSIVNLDERGSKIDAEVNILQNNINEQSDKLKELRKYQEQLEKRQKTKKDRDLNKVKAIKEANVLIKNLTKSVLGSGTHIKIDGENYVLTCAHLIIGSIEENVLTIVSDTGTWSKAEIVKYNKEKDLALLKVPQLKHTAYLEISDIAPKEGSEVIVIGNPSGLVDMITDGIVTKVDKKGYYLITNKIWFGNSGGSLLYKGKLIGVISQILGFSSVSPFGVAAQNYGKAVGLETIQTFLKEANYEPKSE